MNQLRRRFLAGGLAAGGVALAATLAGSLRGLLNSCQAPLPPDPAVAELIRSDWEGIDTRRYLDCHVHLVGTGDSGSGIEIKPQMESLFHPMQYAQRLFHLHAGCVHDAPGRVVGSYVERILNLVDGLAPAAGLLLFVFDRFHDENGRLDAEHSPLLFDFVLQRRLASQGHRFAPAVVETRGFLAPRERKTA